VKAVKCSCGYDVCFECSKQYLLGSTMDPHCMNCRKAWDDEFIYSQFPKTFVCQDLKKHREDVLLDREKSLLPATQVDAEHYLKCKKYLDENKSLRTMIGESNQAYKAAQSTLLSLQGDDWIETRKRMFLYETETLRYKLQVKYNHDILNRFNDDTPILKNRRQTFIRGCPATDCRGFLNENWECGLCHISVCSRCHDKKEDGVDGVVHVCKLENIETAKLLAKDTKPCPSCASMIFKIEGCNQMYCTQCHTAFSWDTCRIETGPIHNPHYYEYLRRNGGNAPPRNLGDIPCGGLPEAWQFSQSLRNADGIHRGKIMGLRRAFDHNQLQVLPRYQINVNNDNKDIRIKYIVKEIDEDQFKKLLQQREKARKKKNEFYMVYQLYQTALADILQRVYTDKDFALCITEFAHLRSYANGLLAKIKNRYNCKVSFVGDDGLIDE
jgi:hypothetical protein